MSSGDANVLLIPSSSMGHLIPSVRLAGALSARQISISILAVRPTISASESLLLSSLPSSIPCLDFPINPLNPSLFPSSSDPFLLHMESLRRSAHLLPSLISSHSPSFSSIIIDISIASTFLPVVVASNIPCFVFHISSATMLALCSAYPFLPHSTESDVTIAGGILKIPNSSLPWPLRHPNHLFKTQFMENGRSLTLAKGILVNTFFAFEAEILALLNSGEVVSGLPPVIALGPLPLVQKQPYFTSSALQWLDEQPEKSVMYVSFGSRTVMSKKQIGELRVGLELSGHRFFWVVKSAIVDREEEEVDIEELLGEGYVKRVEKMGLVVKKWVDQEVVLGHRAVAGFMSHGGWNSMVEAAVAGVRMLILPGNGDQRVNATLVNRSGLGIWPEKWAWDALIAAEEISAKVKEVMEDEKLAETAAMVAAEAAAAVQAGGSSDESFCKLLKKL